jgi:hypothetical protein
MTEGTREFNNKHLIILLKIVSRRRREVQRSRAGGRRRAQPTAHHVALPERQSATAQRSLPTSERGARATVRAVRKRGTTSPPAASASAPGPSRHETTRSALLSIQATHARPRGHVRKYWDRADLQAWRMSWATPRASSRCQPRKPHRHRPFLRHRRRFSRDTGSSTAPQCRCRPARPNAGRVRQGREEQ